MDQETDVKEQVAGLFGRAAATYDQVGPRMFTIFGGRLVDRASLSDGDRALDIATGRGAVLFPACHTVGPQGFVTGIDISPEMVAGLCREIIRRSIRNASTEVMDAESLRFNDGSFHVVLCGLSIFFFPNPRQALSECYRVLQSSGRIAISTWAEGDARWEWFGRLAQEYTVALTGQPDAPVNRPASAHLNRREAMQAALEQAGFHNIEVFIEETELVYRDEEEWWAVQESHWVRNLLEWLQAAGGAETLARFKAQAFEKMQPQRQPDGFHQIQRAACWVADKK